MDNTVYSNQKATSEAPSAKALQAERKRRQALRRAARNRTNHNLLLVGALLLMALVVFLAGLFTKDKAFSDTENRTLAQKPARSLTALQDGSYFTDIESWYNDQFMLRDKWISLHLWELQRLGQKSVSGVYLGKSGQLLSNPETPDEDAVSKTVSAINTFAEQHSDLSTRMLLVPGASTIQQDALPKNAPVRDQLQDISTLESGLSPSIQILDAASSLQAHSDEYIYYKTDHHWTSLGAHYVYEAIASDMDLPVHSFDVYPVATDFEGTLSSRSGSHRVTDTVEVYAYNDSDVQYYVSYGEDSGKQPSIYSRAALDEKDKYTVFFGGNHPKVEITTTANNDRVLLLFKDSYANSFVQFLLPDYEKIIMIDPRYFYGSLDSVLNSGVTDVLLLYSADTLLTDHSLVDVLSGE